MKINQNLIIELPKYELTLPMTKLDLQIAFKCLNKRALKVLFFLLLEQNNPNAFTYKVLDDYNLTEESFYKGFQELVKAGYTYQFKDGTYWLMVDSNFPVYDY